MSTSRQVLKVLGEDAAPAAVQPERIPSLGIWECPECGILNAPDEESAERAIQKGIQVPIKVSPEQGVCAQCHPQSALRRAPAARSARAQTAINRHDLAYESKAAEIIKNLTEDHAADYTSRAGGSEDPWRKGGGGKLKKMKFTGKRKTSGKLPELPAIPTLGSPNNRLKWKPKA